MDIGVISTASCVTIPEALKSAGYRSLTCRANGTSPKSLKPKSEADKHNWPLQRGFDRFYGTIHGAGSFFDPNTLTRDNQFISPFADPEYQTENDREHKTALSTTPMRSADHAVRFMSANIILHQTATNRSLCMLRSRRAHWPMHALPRRTSQSTRASTTTGYRCDSRRIATQRMLNLGLIDADNTVNWPIPNDWKEKEHWEWDKRNMEVYAAMIDNMDQGIGRIVEALKGHRAV